MIEERMKGGESDWCRGFPSQTSPVSLFFFSYNTVKLNSANGMADWDSLIGYLDYIVDPELWVSNADL